MKKTLAFIASLVLMATTFASCGKKDDDDESNGKSGSSSSVDKSDDNDDEDDDDDDKDDKDDKKSSKKDKDDDDADDDDNDKKPSKKDKDDDDADDDDDDKKPSIKDKDDDDDDDDDRKPSKKSDGSIIGTWSLDEGSLDEMDFFMDVAGAEYVFSDSEVEMLLSIDVSEDIYIQGDSILLDGESVEYDYDGKVITIEADGETIELTRVGSADKLNIYGRYSNDEESFMGAGSKLYFDFVDDGETYMIISMKQEYTYDEKTGILTTVDEDGYEDEDQIEINGDKMTVTNDEDGTMIFTRKK